ncbi:MAG: DUF167 domain-containing protein [bacterium]|nr:DUF167 domain-containing protein [bacterium]
MKIFVRAKPNAKNERVEQADKTHFKVLVKEPPKEDRANNAIARALARHFGIASSRVKLVSGFASRQKIFEIPGLSIRAN